MIVGYFRDALIAAAAVCIITIAGIATYSVCALLKERQKQKMGGRVSKNYPDTTFEGDPHAPWYEPVEHFCDECKYYEPGCGGFGICASMWDALKKNYGGDKIGLAAECIVECGNTCEDWEEL